MKHLNQSTWHSIHLTYSLSGLSNTRKSVLSDFPKRREVGWINEAQPSFFF